VEPTWIGRLPIISKFPKQSKWNNFSIIMCQYLNSNQRLRILILFGLSQRQKGIPVFILSMGDDSASSNHYFIGLEIY